MPRSRLRASDADRDKIAERLRQATAEGRIRAEELEQRLEHLFRSTTYGELDALVADLPGKRVTTRRPQPVVSVQGIAVAVVAVAAAVAVLALAALAIAGIFTGWMVWTVLAWVFIRRRGCWTWAGPRQPPQRTQRAYSRHWTW